MQQFTAHVTAMLLFITINTGIVHANESQSDIANVAAQAAKGKSYVEIEFPISSAILTDSSKDSLRALVSQIPDQGSVDKVLVLSWADEEYPSKNLKKLSTGQINLANERNQSVQVYIKSLRNISVERFNLAERPNVLAKLFSTNDQRLKSALVSAGLPTTADESQHPTKASRSIVILKIK